MPPRLCPTVQTNCHLPRQGSGSPACAQGHTPCSAAPEPCTCFPFFSADAEPGAWRTEAALHHHALSLSSHTPVLPSHPSCRDLGGAKPCLVPPLTTALTQARSVQGLPGLSVGRAAEKKHSPHPHTMSRLSEEPEEALGEWDRPRRQAPEAAGGDARGSCYRELCACDPTAAVFEEPQL